MIVALAAVALAEPPTPSWTGPLHVRTCDAPARVLPAQMEDVLGAVVVLRTSAGVGSGFLVSRDGFVLTAAHVVAGQTSVRAQLRAGMELPAQVLRVDTAADVAVVRLAGSGFPCVVTAPPPPLGTDLYAVGSPLGDGLEFSVSRGILSGQRLLEGRALLQTDATINAGNSGGPLLDPSGRAVGIVSSKLVGSSVEGLGFAVPVSTLVQALELEWSGASDDTSAPGLIGARAPAVPTVSQADLPARFAADPAAPAPVHLDQPMIVSGAATATVGWVLVGVTSVAYAGGAAYTASGWHAAQVVNAAGWVLGIGGTSLIVAGTLTEGPGIRVGGRW